MDLPLWEGVTLPYRYLSTLDNADASVSCYLATVVLSTVKKKIQLIYQRQY